MEGGRKKGRKEREERKLGHPPLKNIQLKTIEQLYL